MANGNCDNLLIAVYLSCKSKVFFAPAMDLDMYKHKSTKKSISQLQSYSNVLIPPKVGELASGLVGEGRLPEPNEIIDFLIDHFSSDLPLKNKKVLITAGPTIEEIDPVRFISNHSTGKMGYSLAKEAINLGADVTLISGPSNIDLPSNKIKLVKIKSSDEMLQKTLNFFDDSDIVIMSAAVSDYKPLKFSEKKLKKGNKELNIKLKKTQDILFELGKIKSEQFLVGFALENENEFENAKKKLFNKNLDLIVLNSLNDEGAGFGYDTNKVSVINSKNEVFNYDLKKKSAVAKDIFNHII
jgi:phosphopantothenoylcysteine decarboxylase/phosphopantothenate--cysteine ligase